MVAPIDIPRAVTPKPVDLGQRHEIVGMGKKNIGKIERYASWLAGLTLAGYGLSKRSTLGAALAGVGGVLLLRGITGHSFLYDALDIIRSRNKAYPGILVEKAVTINKSPEELYTYWHNLENLPRIMSHLRSVAKISDLQSHWIADAPAGMTVEWDAEITDDRTNEFISWRSLPDSQIENEGSVRFVEAPGGQGTEVHVKLVYNPPAGSLGAAIAKLFGEEPAQQVTDDLRRFKRMMETGQIPTTEGQPAGKR